MVWRCFSGYGVGLLHKIESNMHRFQPTSDPNDDETFFIKRTTQNLPPGLVFE